MGRARGIARADDYGHLKNHVYFQVCAVTSCNALFALNVFFLHPNGCSIEGTLVGAIALCSVTLSDLL